MRFRVGFGLTFLLIVAATSILVAVVVFILGSDPYKGLPPTLRPLEIVRLLPDQHRDKLLFSVHNTQATTCSRAALASMGLWAPARLEIAAPSSFLEELTAIASSPAFYRLGSDTIFVQKDMDQSIRHELVHALHDQYAELARKSQELTTSDDRFALRAIMEGVALQLTKRSPIHSTFTTDLSTNVLTLAYSYGPRYAHARAGFDPHTLFALEIPSSYDVLFGETTKQVQLPEPTLNAGETIECTDRLGALAILTILMQLGMSSSEAMRIANSWRGDRLDIIVSEAARRYVWTVAFGWQHAADLWTYGPGVVLPLTSPTTTFALYIPN